MAEPNRSLAISLSLCVLAAACSLDLVSRDYRESTGAADGGAEAAVSSGEDAGASFCANEIAPHTFCEDFDRGTFASGWTKTDSFNGAVFRFETEAPRSGPFDLAIAIPETKSEPRPNAVLTRDLEGTPHVIEMAFSLRSDDLAAKTDKAPILSLIVAQRDGGTDEARLVFGATPVLKELGNDANEVVTLGNDHALSVVPKPAIWSRVVVTLTTAPERRVAVHVDGAVALDAALLAPWDPGKASVALGVVFAENPSEAYVVRYDDVTLDVR